MGNKPEYVIGKIPMDVRPMRAYSDEVIAFMDCFSRELRKRAVKLHLSDLSALAYWCRKSNVVKMKEEGNYSRNMGRGLVFHVTPSNVPVNFAFSYFFGLLSGNANIVRVPGKKFQQVTEMIAVLKQLLSEEKFVHIAEKTTFVKYGHEKEITDLFSQMADCRIIWGGDRTIQEIRKSPMKEKSQEIVFADRYSLGILSTEEVLSASQMQLRDLAEHFYNDTYLMDQNACSTPHLLVWVGGQAEAAKKRFWEAVNEAVDKYELVPIKVVDKYTDLCMVAMNQDSRYATLERWGNRIYVWNLSALPREIDRLRGRYGMFYQVAYETVGDFFHAAEIPSKVQTVLYYGIKAEDVWNQIVDLGLSGIDRVVPFGKALDMHPFWDGYDIIGQLSRRVELS